MGSKAEYETKRADRKAARESLVRKDAEMFVDRFQAFVFACAAIRGTPYANDPALSTFEKEREKFISFLCQDKIPS